MAEKNYCQQGMRSLSENAKCFTLIYDIRSSQPEAGCLILFDVYMDRRNHFKI